MHTGKVDPHKAFMFAPDALPQSEWQAQRLSPVAHFFIAQTFFVSFTGGPPALAEDGAALEALRRGGDQTLDITPAACPDKDYAAALQRVQLALHHLDESLPNAQRARTEAALKVLIRGASELQEFVAERLARAKDQKGA